MKILLISRVLLLCLAFHLISQLLSAQNNPVPASFFAVDPWNPNDFPVVDFGTVAHPQFAWPEVARCRGCITDANFARLDAYVQGAIARKMYDPATNTVNVSLTLGLTPDWALTIANYDTKPCKGTDTVFSSVPTLRKICRTGRTSFPHS